MYSFPRLLGDILLFLFAAFPIIYIGNELGIKYSGYFAVGVMFITIVSPLFSFRYCIITLCKSCYSKERICDS